MREDPTPQEEAGRVAFGVRLKSILIELGMSQATLAEKSGISTTEISRIISGDRNPTLVTLDAIGPVIGVDTPRMVTGTDAEHRIAEASALVRRADYEAATKKIVEYEQRTSDLEARLRERNDELGREVRRRAEAEDQREALANELRQLHWEREREKDDLGNSRRRTTELEGDLRRYRRGLARAVAEVAHLKQKLAELAEEVRKSGSSSKLAMLLAGVAAATGVVTMTTFLRANDDDDESLDDDDDNTEPPN